MDKIKNAIGIVKSFGLNIKGTPELLEQAKQIENTIIEALEKQIPKKRADGWYGKNTECPICHIVASNKHCPNCGQALDWSDSE